jgi:hypothetical protein
MLIYKGFLAGINYTREEPYTTKASFLDLDFIPSYGEKPLD